MNEKDYVQFAYQIHAVYEAMSTMELSGHHTLDLIYRGMISVFTKDNPQFDVARFHETCFPGGEDPNNNYYFRG